MRALFLFALLLALGIAGPALAQDKAGERAQAKEFFRAGEHSYNASQFGVAADAFEQAYALLPVPAIAFSTAQAYRLQYFVDQDPTRLKRAIELYRKYVEEIPKGGRRQDAVSSLAELEPILLRLEAQQAESGGGPIESASMLVRTHIMITSSVQDAVVKIDDGEPSSVPVDVDVEPGKYRVRVTAKGYFPYDEKRTVTTGQFHLVPVQLREKPAVLQFRGASGASVTVDGRPVGTLPLELPLEVEPGEHIIAVKERGHSGWSRVVDPKRGETLVLQPSLDRTRQRTISYVIGGASIVSLATGTLYLLSASRYNRDAGKFEEKRISDGLTANEFVSYRDAIGDRDEDRQVGLGFLATGGILAVAGGLLYLVDMPSAESRPVRSRKKKPDPDAKEAVFEPMALVPLVPTSGRDPAGLALTGRF